MHRAWLLALIILPTAQAAEITPAHGATIDIEVGQTLAMDAEITIRCAGLDDALQTATHLVVEHQAEDPGIIVEGPERHPLPDMLCVQEEQQTIRLAYNVTATDAAGGEHPRGIIHALRVEDGTGATLAEAEFRDEVVVAWQGAITTGVPVSRLQGGPQKQLVFSMDVHYEGNALATVRFDYGEQAQEGYVILPTPIVIEPGQTETVEIVYSTPFANGANHAIENFTIVATPESTKDPSLQGEARSETFQATTEGVYVPGPGIGALVAALGLALARRRG